MLLKSYLKPSICLCTFFKYSMVCVYVETIAVLSLSTLFRSLCVSLYCASTITASFSSNVIRHSRCRFQTIATFHSILCTNPCPVISTILVILLFFVCVYHNLFSFGLFHFPSTPLSLAIFIFIFVSLCVYVALFNTTFYVDVSILNCIANGPTFSLLSKW